MRNRVVLAPIVLVSLLSGALALGGCADPAEPDPPAESGSAMDEEAEGVYLPPEEQVIGLTELGDGRVRAVGLLQYRADEGAIWVIVDGTVGEEPPEDAPVIAVIENMADLDSACGTSGTLVYAEGTLGGDDGTLPGPALTAEFVRRAAGP